jgi:hypothetical protein
MRSIETRAIAGFEVTTQKLPSMAGSRLRFKLGRLLAPAIAGLRGKRLDNLVAQDIADLAPAFAALVQQLEPRTHDELILEVFACTYVIGETSNGSKIKFDLTSTQIIDQAFDGDVDAMWLAAKFVLEVNLRGLASLFPNRVGGEQPAPTLSS